MIEKQHMGDNIKPDSKSTLNWLHIGAFILIIALLYSWGAIFYPHFPDSIRISLFLVSTCFWVLLALLPKPVSPLLSAQTYTIINLFFSCYGTVIILIAMFRLEYSRPILLLGSMLNYIWLLSYYFFIERSKTVILSAINNFEIQSFSEYPNIHLSKISFPFSVEQVSDGVIVNLHNSLSEQEEKLIADCSLSNVPVYHSETIKERLNKRVPTTHLNDSTITKPKVHLIYPKIKPVLEKLLIILSLPVVLPLVLFLCIAIYLSDKGSIFYSQHRIGYRNQTFKLYKFRTMSETNGDTEAQFASQQHQRISKLGYWLRKTRLDELPQFLNVLKGEMALIGPRPEQPDFVHQFESNIAFYNYRHSVKPGISGWAQIMQGYADNTDMTRHKLGYDLYYIKHQSFDLDLEIFFKTFLIMFTGKGAK